MKNISPCLWFDNQAEEASKYYASIFKNTKIGTTTTYDAAGAKVSGQKEGSVMTVEMDIEGMHFTFLNGGPIFTLTPATSFFVNCDSVEEIDRLWSKLSDGGSVLMELQQYPFSEKYGWCNDKFGVSWQLSIGKTNQKIRPALLFVGDHFGKAEEAINLYTSLIPNSAIAEMPRYEKGERDKEGFIKYSLFTLNGNEFTAMESSLDHQFDFTQAVSYIINCDTQEEIDHLYETLSEGGEQQPCGWLIDRYGVAWQICPANWEEMMSGDSEAARRAFAAMLTMTKLDMAELQSAYDGK